MKMGHCLAPIRMAQSGSAAATFSNVCSASSCQKECKSATARLKSALTCGLHEVSNDTAPRYAGMGISAIPSCPEAFTDRINSVRAASAGGKFGLIKVDIPADEVKELFCWGRVA